MLATRYSARQRNWGDFYLAIRRLKESGLRCQEAAEVLRNLASREPGNLDVQVMIAENLLNLTHSNRGHFNFDQAYANCSEAIDIWESLLDERDSRLKRNYLTNITVAYQLLANLSLLNEEWAAARRAFERGLSHVEELVNLNPDDPISLGLAAATFSLASGAVLKDDGLAAVEQQKRAETYALRSLESLRELFQLEDSGPAARARILEDPSLDALRDRGDFKQLLNSGESLDKAK